MHPARKGCSDPPGAKTPRSGRGGLGPSQPQETKPVGQSRAPRSVVGDAAPGGRYPAARPGDRKPGLKAATPPRGESASRAPGCQRTPIRPPIRSPHALAPACCGRPGSANRPAGSRLGLPGLSRAPKLLGPIAPAGAAVLLLPARPISQPTPMTIKVQVRSNESLEAALRRFKRECNFGGVFRLARAGTWHEKRSDKNRRERRERIRIIQRSTRKAQRRAGGRAR